MQEEIEELKKRIQALEEHNGISDKNEVVESDDVLLDEAIRLVVEHDQASASLLQRRLKIGYARAARILDQLEEKGIVSEASGATPRDVLVKNYDEYINNAKKNKEK